MERLGRGHELLSNHGEVVHVSGCVMQIMASAISTWHIDMAPMLEAYLARVQMFRGMWGEVAGIQAVDAMDMRF